MRIPGLKMTVVAADGQHVRPVTVDEFRIAVAETSDVTVEPAGGEAFTIFAQAMDRTGYAAGTLAVRAGLRAPLPDLDLVGRQFARWWDVVAGVRQDVRPGREQTWAALGVTSDPARGIGAGLSSADVGLRARYEVRREIAPYVGVTWHRAFFGTADQARAAGESRGGARLAVGLRLWR